MSRLLYAFDLDGTLFRGGQVLPDAVETLTTLRLRGHAIRYVTNNSAAYPPEVRAKLQLMGFDARLDEIFTSGMAAADFLARSQFERVFVVGDQGLKQVLREAGIRCVDSDAQAVLAGICHAFDYQILNMALQQIAGGAEFYATNRDATYPLENGVIQPGAGAMVAAIEACSGVKPMVFGKPEKHLMDLIMSGGTYTADRCVVVGDRLDTDVEFGRRIGCKTYLVLTGDAKTLPPGQWGGASLRGLL